MPRFQFASHSLITLQLFVAVHEEGTLTRALAARRDQAFNWLNPRIAEGIEADEVLRRSVSRQPKT